MSSMCTIKEGQELNRVYHKYYSGEYVDFKDLPALKVLTASNSIVLIEKNGRPYAFGL